MNRLICGDDLVFDEENIDLVQLSARGRTPITGAERQALLDRVKAGESVQIAFRARPYVQNEGKPNRKFVRVKPAAAARFAKSFRGQPFLRDHSGELADRGGTIVSSELIKTETGFAVEMEVRAVKAWAVEGLLDGTIDRFSVGFFATAPVMCSVHGKQMQAKDGCLCWPGQMVEGEVVEAVFTGADGTEVSAVNVPAVPEAQGVEFRAALSALAEESEREHVAAQKEMNMKIATHLGLSGAATEDEILTAIRKVTDDKAATESRLAAEVAAHGLVKGRLAEAEAERTAAQAAATKAKLDAAIEQLYASGRLPLARDTAGERVPHALEAHLRDMVAKLGYEAFASYAASLPKIAPVGSPLQLARDVKQPATSELLSNPDVRKAALAGGVTEADIIKFNVLGVLAPAEGSV